MLEGPKRILKDEEDQDRIEYALLPGVLVRAAIAALSTLGKAVNYVFSQ